MAFSLDQNCSSEFPAADPVHKRPFSLPLLTFLLSFCFRSQFDFSSDFQEGGKYAAVQRLLTLNQKPKLKFGLDSATT